MGPVGLFADIHPMLELAAVSQEGHECCVLLVSSALGQNRLNVGNFRFEDIFVAWVIDYVSFEIVNW